MTEYKERLDCRSCARVTSPLFLLSPCSITSWCSYTVAMFETIAGYDSVGVSMDSRFCISSWRSNCCCRLWGVWPTQPGTQGKPRLCVQRADTTSDFCQSSFLLFMTGVHSFMPYEAGPSRPCRWLYRPVFFSVSAGLAFRSNKPLKPSELIGYRNCYA